MHQLPVLLLRAFALLPLPLIHMMGARLGLLLYLLPNKNRDITLRNLELCFPERSLKQRKRIARKSLMETGKAILEKGAIMTWSRKRTLKLVKEIEGLEQLQQAQNNGKGTILAIPHLGDWEMIGMYCSANYPMTSLYRPQRGAMDEFIKTGRERLGAHLVPTEGKGLKALYTALQRGEIIAILPDQNPGAGKGVFVPFFGIPTNTMVLLSRLTQKTGASVLYAYAERLSWGRGFRLHFHTTPDAIHDQDIMVSTTAMNAGLEQVISTLPEQYWWSYPRFRARPESEPPIY